MPMSCYCLKNERHSAQTSDNRKQKKAKMDLDVDMSTEVFETPDPEVTFQAYTAVRSSSSHSHRVGASAPEDAHFYDKVRQQNVSIMLVQPRPFFWICVWLLTVIHCVCCVYRATQS